MSHMPYSQSALVPLPHSPHTASRLFHAQVVLLNQVLVVYKLVPHLAALALHEDGSLLKRQRVHEPLRARACTYSLATCLVALAFKVSAHGGFVGKHAYASSKTGSVLSRGSCLLTCQLSELRLFSSTGSTRRQHRDKSDTGAC